MRLRGEKVRSLSVIKLPNLQFCEADHKPYSNTGLGGCFLSIGKLERQ